MENVNHPKHYNIGKIEVIDAIEDWNLNFNLGNAVKYISRCCHKGKKEEDLKKAIWYIERELGKNNTKKEWVSCKECSVNELCLDYSTEGGCEQEIDPEKGIYQ